MTRAPRRTLTAAALAATVAIFPLAACSDSEEPVTEATTVVPAPEEETTTPTETETVTPTEEGAAGATELEEGSVSQQQIDDKVGEDVIFMAEVTEVVSPNALTVGGQEDGQEPALIVGADVPADAAVGDTLQVRGTVEEFDILVVEQEIGTDLNDDDFTTYDGMPYILAATALRQ